MDIDEQFSSLAALAPKGSLTRVTASSGPANEERWTLATSLWAIVNQWGGGPAGPDQTLLTLEEFARCLPHTANRRWIWMKIAGQQTQYLDTVVEAAWWLHFTRTGQDVELEKPFDTKNADMLLTLNGHRLWLDVKSVWLQPAPFDRTSAESRENPFSSLVDSRGIVDLLGLRAKRAYVKQFKASVRSGLLVNDRIGILLCVLGAEASAFPALFGRATPAPTTLFDQDTQGLTVVWVHTLRPRPGSQILEPVELAQWWSPDTEAVPLPPA